MMGQQRDNTVRVTLLHHLTGHYLMRGLLLLLGLVHTTATARPLICQQPLWELHLARECR